MIVGCCQTGVSYGDYSRVLILGTRLWHKFFGEVLLTEAAFEAAVDAVAREIGSRAFGASAPSLLGGGRGSRPGVGGALSLSSQHVELTAAGSGTGSITEAAGSHEAVAPGRPSQLEPR
jgi:hypothetical protein